MFHLSSHFSVAEFALHLQLKGEIRVAVELKHSLVVWILNEVEGTMSSFGQSVCVSQVLHFCFLFMYYYDN